MFGAHQKIDRLARRSLNGLISERAHFPSNKMILHFEGVNGPDAIKRKSPARDEPWHYYMPFDETDTQLLRIIEDHYDLLVKALKEKDDVRAGFEAAWLAHAIVDGLTPPHHHPYEKELAVLRGGEGLETRDSVRSKIIIPGDNVLKLVGNNWKMWGPKGLMSSHGFFEWGVAVLLKSFTQKQVALSQQDIQELQEYGVLELFRRKAKEVAALGMYDTYQKEGWTRGLVHQARRTLLPVIVHTVALAWYAACVDAGVAKKRLPASLKPKARV